MNRFGSFIRRFHLGKLTVTLPKLPRGSKDDPAKGSIIILHGSCDSGPGMKAWVDQVRKSEFKFNDYRILYPSAPHRPYTLLNGQEAGIWFDRLSLGPTMPEDLISIEATANDLSELLQQESQHTGIPLSKMVVGGFSMGGIMALHLGYRFQTQLAGVFALSSFLPLDSEVFNTLRDRMKLQKYKKPDRGRRQFLEEAKGNSDLTKAVKSGKKHHTHTPTPTIDKILKDIKLEEGVRPPQFPRLFMSQGLRDPLVLYPWAKRTFSVLRRYGVNGHFFTHPSAAHTLEKNQLILLHRWVQDVLSEKTCRPPKRKINRRRKREDINDEACEPVDPTGW